MTNDITRTKWFLYVVETILLVILGLLVWQRLPANGANAKTLLPDTVPAKSSALLVPIAAPTQGIVVTRQLALRTNIPDRPNIKIQQYTVEKGDSAWSISAKFKLKPESILWANDGLSAEANTLKIGDTLNIPPVDGVLHTVLEGDTIESISLLHGTSVDEILGYMGNGFDITSLPNLKKDQQVMIPNGTSPIVWNDPEPIFVAGSKTPGGYSGPLVNRGTGTFIWPIGGTILLNQEYWGCHPAIDINTYFRQPVFASDSGTVVFSGWSTSGYGNLVIIDHGNGYRTYYAHNEANLVSVGLGVVQGQQIAESGSTGNSTGNHLDFRIRATGGNFYNPLDFLP
jgi:murein DD-endopeptidase MepM/ murein hydrolase activator NlpD